MGLDTAIKSSDSCDKQESEVYYTVGGPLPVELKKGAAGID
jgi:hypothetical protein